MSTDFKLMPGAACLHVLLAPQYEIRPDGVTELSCFYGYRPDEKSRFFKDVAQNRGVRVEFFGERDAALRWLGVAGSQAG